MTLATRNLRAVDMTHESSEMLNDATVRNGCVPHAKQISDLKTLPTPARSDCESSASPTVNSGLLRRRRRISASSYSAASTDGPSSLKTRRRRNDSVV